MPMSMMMKMGKKKSMKQSIKKMCKMRAPLKFQTTAMRDHLADGLKKLRAKYGRSLKGVNYGMAMGVVGATLAARLTSRGLLERNSGGKMKGKLGK